MPTTTKVKTFTGPVSPEWQSRGVWLSQAWKKIPSEPLDWARQEIAVIANLRNVDISKLDFLWSAEDERGLGRMLEDEAAAYRKFCAAREMAKHGIFNKMQFAGGHLAGFGSPERAGGIFEWIPILAWKRLDRGTSEPDVLTGGGNSYYDVHVVDLSHWQHDAPKPEEKEKTPWDAYQAQVFLSAEKVSNRHRSRPNEERLRALLELKFTSVTRDPMRAVARIVWPDALPGVKRGTKRAAGRAITR